jgi:hypothetical protein
MTPDDGNQVWLILPFAILLFLIGWGFNRDGQIEEGTSKPDEPFIEGEWSEEGWDWETFVLWAGHCGSICFQCQHKKDHSACHHPECQCKNEVCTEIRWNKRLRGWLAVTTPSEKVL